MPFHSAVHSDVEASAGAGPPEAGSQQALNRYLSHRQQTMRSMTTRTREERYLSTRVFQLAASAVLIAFALLMLRVTSGVSIALALAGFILRAFVPMSGYWGASRRDEGALLVFCSCEAVNAFYFFMLFVSSILYEYYLTAGISFGIFFIHMASHHYGRRLYDRVKVRIDITNGFELVGRQPPVVAVPQAEAVAGQPLRYALATTIPVYEIGDDEDETKKGDRQAPAPLVTTSSTSPLVVRADTNHPCVPQGPHGAQSPHGVPLV